MEIENTPLEGIIFYSLKRLLMSYPVYYVIYNKKMTFLFFYIYYAQLYLSINLLFYYNIISGVYVMSKFNLMLIATIAIGVFALPMVVATFSGSHEYVAPENVECQKCHPDVQADLDASVSNHTHAGVRSDGSEWTLFCTDCHAVSGIGLSPGGGHAAQKVDCGFCHNGSNFGPDAWNWWHNETGLLQVHEMKCTACHREEDMLNGDYHPFIYEVFNEITLETAAHNGFYLNALNDDTLKGASEACVGCHTHAEINFTQPLGSFSMIYDPVDGTFGKE